MHGFRIAGNEGMPPVEIPTGIEQAISAGIRHPVVFFDFRGRQLEAVRHVLLAIWVVAALAAFKVEQLTRRVGVIDDAGVGIFKLEQAAAAATVAQ